ncbi:hypothetical protein ACCD10_24700 [Pseudomonas sp. Pseusp122]|uniref:hypothetical protein n=1 Tax=unclassified Pseudomonas TaxID=196821 RepID=UPI0039A45A9B
MKNQQSAESFAEYLVRGKKADGTWAVLLNDEQMHIAEADIEMYCNPDSGRCSKVVRLYTPTEDMTRRGLSIGLQRDFLPGKYPVDENSSFVTYTMFRRWDEAIGGWYPVGYPAREGFIELISSSEERQQMHARFEVIVVTDGQRHKYSGEFDVHAA